MFPSRVGYAEAFFGLIIIAAFIYGTYEMNQGGKRAVQFNGLRDRVLKHIETQPNRPQFSLDDLQNDGVVTADDVQFLKDNSITYHAVGAKSPPEALLFVRRHGNEETRHYKDAKSDVRRTWPSPNSALALVVAPQARAASEQTVSLIEVAGGRLVTSWDLGDARANHVFWSDDSRFGAVSVHRYGKNPWVHYIDCGIVFEVTPQGVRRIEAPDELRPDHCLPPKHAGKKVHFNDNWVMPHGWHGHELDIQSQGIGRIFGGGAEPDHSFNVIYRFNVQFKDGKATITKKARRHYAETPVK